MGNCKSSNTIDILCNHNKPHIALCLGEACTREDGDRRLCEECLVDHMCIDRTTIDDAIKNDVYEIRLIIEKYERDQNSQNVQGGLAQTVKNFQNHFFECFKSYQSYYEIYLSQYILSGIPDAEIFGEAAAQIVEAYEKGDLGYIQKQGCQILLDTYTNPQLIKQIVTNLDQASKRLSLYSTQVENKLKRLQEEFYRNLQTAPYNVSQQNSFSGSILNIDASAYSYEFPAYLTTVDTNRLSGSLISLNCNDHNQKIQVICCDKCPNRDVRLCGQCLLSHKCNAGLRIKLKTFSTDQSQIIEASMKYQKKKNEIQEIKQRIKATFEDIMKATIREMEVLRVNSRKLLGQSQLQDVSPIIKDELPYYIEKLKQHQEIKQQLLSYDVAISAVQFQNKLVVQLEEIGKKFLQCLSQVEDLGTFEKKPSQNIEGSTFVATTNIVANMGGTLNGMNMSLQKQPSVNITFQVDNAFENRVDGCPIIRVLKDFGDDEDNYISDLIYYQNNLIVSTVEGLITVYQGTGENKLADYQLDGKCSSVCGLQFKGFLGIAASIGNYEEHKIAVLTFSNSSLLVQGYLLGHTDPILKVKQMISPQTLVSCSGDHSLRIWDTSSSKMLEEIKPRILSYHKMAVRDFIIINSSLLVSGSFDETIQFYDLKTEKLVYVLQVEDWIYCLQNLTEKIFAAGTGSGDIRLISTQNFSEIQRVRVAPQYINGITSFTNPNYLFVSCKNRDNYIIRLQEYRQIDYITKNEEVDYIPEGILVVQNYIIYGDANTLKIKDAN